MVVDAIALAAAACYAAAMVLEQRAARLSGADLVLRWRLLSTLPRQSIWVAGVIVNAVGYLLRFIAIDHGSLVVVQPLLGTSLLIALPVAAAWQGDRLGRIEWAGVVAIVAGLALFLGRADPSRGRSTATTGAWLAVGGAVIAVTIVALLAGAGRPWLRPAALAAGGGVLLALAAALMKAVAPVLGHHFWHLPATWTPYALVLVTAAGVLLVQSAFADAPLHRSLPALMVAEPVASVVIGAALFGERLASGTAGRVSEGAGLVLLVAGIGVAATSPLLDRRVEVST